MKRRRILLLLAFAAVAAGIVLFFPRGPKEPVYEGVPLTDWIAKAYYSGDADFDASARKALEAAGANALPFFLHQFAFRESSPALKFRRWIASRAKRTPPDQPLKLRLTVAAYGIRLLGTNAIPALPVLAGYFDDPQRARHAASAMAGCGETALPWALKAIGSTNGEVAAAGLQTLGAIAPKTEAALPPLVSLLGHTNRGMQNWAAIHLSTLKFPTELMLPIRIRPTSSSVISSLEEWKKS